MSLTTRFPVVAMVCAGAGLAGCAQCDTCDDFPSVAPPPYVTTWPNAAGPVGTSMGTPLMPSSGQAMHVGPGAAGTSTMSAPGDAATPPPPNPAGDKPTLVPEKPDAGAAGGAERKDAPEAPGGLSFP